ncbi:hypothetical protein [Devosia naphthalenivorans]|uniref:hypothetical protein n=1 Tax=Devosia naphthalenivorans TaxID=2082392 RepID=UPI000D35390A|nr:hypothetical protein [Devosia naphthalenivorans]
MASCNEHGVYDADEKLALPYPKKGWRGSPLADISLADLGTHWIWATGYQMHSGNWEGAGSPLSDHEAWAERRCASRAAAIAAASDYLRGRLQSRADGGDRDASAVCAWLDSLIPNQLDLFGAAA